MGRKGGQGPHILQKGLFSWCISWISRDDFIGISFFLDSLSIWFAGQVTLYINVMYLKMHDIRVFLYPSVLKHGTCHLSAKVILNQLFLYLPSSKKTGRWELLAVAMVWSEPLGRHAIPLKRSWCSGIRSPSIFKWKIWRDIVRLRSLDDVRSASTNDSRRCGSVFCHCPCGIAVFMRRVSMSQGFTAWCCPGPPPASLGGSTVP